MRRSAYRRTSPLALTLSKRWSNRTCSDVTTRRSDGQSQRESEEEGAGQDEHDRPADGASCRPIRERPAQVLRLHR